MKNIEAYIFDQDGTLYPRQTALSIELSARTRAWLLENADSAILSFDELKRKFPNFTDALEHLGLSLDQWHAMVCDPIADEMSVLIAQDPGLINFLSSLPGNKYLVTLSSQQFTERLLSVLGLTGEFKRIFNLNYKDKGPAYKEIQKIEGVPPGKIAVFGDNEEIDLMPARNQGLEALFVDPLRPIVEQYHELVKNVLAPETIK